MASTSFSLGEFAGFVSDQIGSGRYRNASDVMRAALRLLQEREERLLALRRALKEGEDSGPPEPFDPVNFQHDLKRRHGPQG